MDAEGKGFFMSYQIKNLLDNDDVTVLWPKEGSKNDCGPFKAIQWDRDLSVTPWSAQTAYFASEMDVCRRQLICDTSIAPVKIQAGMMQMIIGDVPVKTGVKSAGDLARKLIRATVTDETIIKPEYAGSGIVICEPTFRHLICLPLTAWGGSLVLDDGIFAACDARIKESIKYPDSVGAAIAGNEGLFKLKLDGEGAVVIESPCPMVELIIVRLDNDELKIDGNLALAWTSGLRFTVERVTRTLVGSAASGEGLVNVYRGTGTVIITPTQPTTRAGLGE